ncbi:uncharacterized protein LOC125953353 [Anopheles darlingi]|uniref:uncharacterized protein LOC125953353 n=1 Tax=Anopheles darlingi TaxID=43151 RepID=UPI0021005A55|nr:uncharacterized protein LOC125953353 [Anopheles darlingi]
MARFMVKNGAAKVVLVVLLVLTSVIHGAPQKKPYEKLSALKARAEQLVEASKQQPAAGTEDQQHTDESEETLEQIQAKSAQYAYDTSVNDTINDHSIQRKEERNGLSLKGYYSYSDGFFKRTVHYEADDKGYRVVKELSIPIGNGPQVDPNGKADVSSSLTGSYSITADDIAKPQRKSASDEDEDEAAAAAEDEEEAEGDSEEQ